MELGTGGDETTSAKAPPLQFISMLFSMCAWRSQFCRVSISWQGSGRVCSKPVPNIWLSVLSVLILLIIASKRSTTCKHFSSPHAITPSLHYMQLHKLTTRATASFAANCYNLHRSPRVCLQSKLQVFVSLKDKTCLSSCLIAVVSEMLEVLGEHSRSSSGSGNAGAAGAGTLALPLLQALGSIISGAEEAAEASGVPEGVSTAAA
eukprot:scaffold233825_cov23-Tisochrysis_lutea.AAC.1